jgi:hypothetical protein
VSPEPSATPTTEPSTAPGGVAPSPDPSPGAPRGNGPAGLAGTLTVAQSGHDGQGRVAIEGLDDAVGTAFTELGLTMWTVPAAAVGVPGLLVLVVVLVQVAGGGAWVPVTRRVLADLGVRRRRRRGRAPR